MTQETIQMLCDAAVEIETIAVRLAKQTLTANTNEERLLCSQIFGLKQAWQIIIDRIPDETQGGFLTWDDIVWSYNNVTTDDVVDTEHGY